RATSAKVAQCSAILTESYASPPCVPVLVRICSPRGSSASNPLGLAPSRAPESTIERRLWRCLWQQDSRPDAECARGLDRQRGGAPAGLQFPGRGPAVAATLQHQIVALRRV